MVTSQIFGTADRMQLPLAFYFCLFGGPDSLVATASKNKLPSFYYTTRRMCRYLLRQFPRFGCVDVPEYLRQRVCE